jgi:hypothetical protein
MADEAQPAVGAICAPAFVTIVQLLNLEITTFDFFCSEIGLFWAWVSSTAVQAGVGLG